MGCINSKSKKAEYSYQVSKTKNGDLTKRESIVNDVDKIDKLTEVENKEERVEKVADNDSIVEDEKTSEHKISILGKAEEIVDDSKVTAADVHVDAVKDSKASEKQNQDNEKVDKSEVLAVEKEKNEDLLASKVEVKEKVDANTDSKLLEKVNTSKTLQGEHNEEKEPSQVENSESHKLEPK